MKKQMTETPRVEEGKVIAETRLGIKISPPYGPDQCSGKDNVALTRVRKMISQIMQEIKLN